MGPLKFLKTRSGRLIIMMILTGAYFVAEIVVGHITGSIALVADSFHMLSDILSLIVALVAIRIAKRSSKKNTFGWVRAEVLGALVNSVFLLALCFTIVVDTIQRMISPETIENLNLLLIVGGVGLIVNLIGMALFSNVHGHSHGHSQIHEVTQEEVISAEQDITLPETPMTRYPERTLNAIISINEATEKNKGQRGMNMKAVFLHIMADALGSVVVIVSGLIVKYVPKKVDGSYQSWTQYVDPVLSLVMVALIVSSTVPLFKESALILLQTVPNHIDVLKLRQNLLLEVPEIEQVHELHVWQLSGGKIIASAHVKRKNLSNYMSVANSIKQFFHKEGIHSTTIQVEEYDTEDSESDTNCLLSCQDKRCVEQVCCSGDKIAEHV